MPFYEYQCGACGAQVEVLQKISDAPLKKCPECGKSKLAKQISAPVFRLKGGGWYETDFKTDKDNKRNLVDSDKGESAAKEESKAEAKPDAKAENKAEAKSDAKPAASAGSKGESAGSSRSRTVPPTKRPAAKPSKPAARKPVPAKKGKPRR